MSADKRKRRQGAKIHPGKRNSTLRGWMAFYKIKQEVKKKYIVAP